MVITILHWLLFSSHFDRFPTVELHHQQQSYNNHSSNNPTPNHEKLITYKNLLIDLRALNIGKKIQRSKQKLFITLLQVEINNICNTE